LLWENKEMSDNYFVQYKVLEEGIVISKANKIIHILST
jgi:hypothetical protein